MKYYPAFLNLADRLCIVVGGGGVAERKVLSLLKAGAAVRVISPELNEGLQRLKEEGRIQHIDRAYQKGDLKDAFLIIAATSDMDVNKAVYEEAKDRPVNVVDVPELCSFIVPSIVERGPLLIAISTSGASPAMARSIREELEGIFKKDFEEFFRFFEEIRHRIKALDIPPSERAELFKELGSRRVLRILLADGVQRAKQEIMEVLAKRGISWD